MEIEIWDIFLFDLTLLLDFVVQGGAIGRREISQKMDENRRVHPDCINASNPYHECVEYCFRKIAEAKAQMEQKEAGNFLYNQ